jgi:hypothetical protein
VILMSTMPARRGAPNAVPPAQIVSPKNRDLIDRNTFNVWTCQRPTDRDNTYKVSLEAQSLNPRSW